MLPCSKAHGSNWGSNAFQKANTISLINLKTLKRSALLIYSIKLERLKHFLHVQSNVS